MKWIENGEKVVYGTINIEDILGKITVTEGQEADGLLRAMNVLQGREEEREYRDRVALKNPPPPPVGVVEED